MEKLNIEQIKIIEKKNNVVIDEDTMMYVGPNDPCWKKIPSEWLFCDCCGNQVISDNPEIAADGLCDRCNREINEDSQIIGWGKEE